MTKNEDTTRELAMECISASVSELYRQVAEQRAKLIVTALIIGAGAPSYAHDIISVIKAGFQADHEARMKAFDKLIELGKDVDFDTVGPALIGSDCNAKQVQAMLKEASKRIYQ